MPFVAQFRRVRSRCVAAGVRSCQGVETLPPSPYMWPAGSATRIIPPVGIAIVPCGPGVGWVL